MSKSEKNKDVGVVYVGIWIFKSVLNWTESQNKSFDFNDWVISNYFVLLDHAHELCFELLVL